MVSFGDFPDIHPSYHALLAETMLLETERSGGRSGDAPVAGSVRGALAASLSRAPFRGEAQSWPRSLRGRHFRATRRRRYGQRHVVPEQLHRYVLGSLLNYSSSDNTRRPGVTPKLPR